jgi:hypothetical protein
MNSDAFFCIGKTHQICQDYAEAGADHVILSDGCSTAADSNIGAILLSRAAKLMLKRYPNDVGNFCEEVAIKSKSYADAMELPEECLYATLGMITGQERRFEAMLHGDGVIAGRRRGTLIWDVSVYEFPSGAPYYLAYKLSQQWRNTYLQRFGVESRLTTYEVVMDTKKSEDVQRGSKVRNDEGSLGPFVRDYPYGEYDMVAVMSDGATSFQKTVSTQTSKKQESVHVCDVLREVLNFKNYNGAFVQRRCKAAFRKFAEESVVNMDDFSLGVVYHYEGVYQGQGTAS